MPAPDFTSKPGTSALREPKIACVICTRDRSRSLCETLASVWLQTRLPDELVLIDDGRLDHETRRLITDRCRELCILCKYERTEAPGLTRARNRAAALADSDVLLFIDDDVTCDSGLVQEIARLMRDPLVSGVTATVREPMFERLGPRLYQYGYRLAGWWSVRPRGRPAGSPPAAITCGGQPNGMPDSAGVRRARWLSGAAMALRRELVRKHPFDESLADYALGEDREYGYRLGREHWFLQSDCERVIHRRDPSPRADARRMGRMTSYNYLYILHKTCKLNLGDRVLIVWSLFVLMLMHLVWAVGRNRRSHLAQLAGMFDGILEFWNDRAASEGSNRRKSTGHRFRRRSAVARDVRCSSQVVASPLRVLFVTNRLETGGAEQLLVSLACRLPALGVRPYIACLKDAGPLADVCRKGGISVSEHLLRYKTDAAVIGRMRSIFREEGIDVVVVAHSGGDRMFWSALVGGLTGTPVVVWSHWFPREGHRHVETANRALYRFVDAFVALGERHREALIRHENVPAGRIEIIRNGIDLTPFLAAASWSTARHGLRLADDHVAVALIGNFRPEKRHDVFIEAARRLARRDSNLRFFIVGDGPHRETVHAAAAASRLSHETLRLLGPRDDVPRILRAMDVCCLCSEVECFSVTMLEAAAAGCAFVGPDTGSISEFLEHGRSGLLIRPADVASLADAIEALAKDAGLRHRLAAEARRRVFTEFGVERMAAEFADLLHAVGRRSATGSSRTLPRRAAIEAGCARPIPVATGLSAAK